jgi:hypothetical protein
MKKPVALKKLEGTYRPDRDDERAEGYLPALVPSVTSVTIPPEITDDVVKQHFYTHTSFLMSLSLLQESDLPHLNQMYLLLQQIRVMNKKIAEIEAKGIVENVDLYLKLTSTLIKLTGKYTGYAVQYYITPHARTKLTIDALSIKKMQGDTRETITQRLLNRKRA